MNIYQKCYHDLQALFNTPHIETRNNSQVDKIKEIIHKYHFDTADIFTDTATVNKVITLLENQRNGLSANRLAELNGIVARIRRVNASPIKQPQGNFQVPISSILYISNHKENDWDETMSDNDDEDKICCKDHYDFWAIDEERHWPNSNLTHWQEEDLDMDRDTDDDRVKDFDDKESEKNASRHSPAESIDSAEERGKVLERLYPGYQKRLARPVNWNQAIERSWQQFKKDYLN